MTSSTTNSSRTDAPRAVADEDVIEFAEYTEDELTTFQPESPTPQALAAPNWFKARASSAVDDSPLATSIKPIRKSVKVDELTAEDGPIQSPTLRDEILNRVATPIEQPRRKKKSARPTTNDEAKSSSGQRRRKGNSSSTQDDKQTAAVATFDWEKWRQTLRKAVIGAYGTSLLIHLLLLVALSAVLIQQKVTSEAMSTQLSEADGVPEAFDGLVELSLPKAGSDLMKSPLMLPTPIADPRLFAAPDVIANAVQAEGKENGSNEFGDADSFQFKMPTGGKAVKKGSFAAWTVPADPKPREDYLIIIRIKLPPGLKTYRVADIGGEVIGTDGFRLEVPFDRRRPEATRTERNGKVVPVKQNDLLKIVDGHAQIVVSIPGASALVKDTIKVRSKLLKEDQNLEIEF